MKDRLFFTALFTSVALTVQGQPATVSAQPAAPLPATPADTPYAVVERGPHHRVWERVTYELGPSGQAVPRVHRYQELATGMHYKDANGQWVETKEQINILPDGTASATQGQHQAYFPGDINQGVIHLVTPDGQHLTSRPLGIGYDDGTHTVLLSQLKDSTGQVVNNNQVVYPDCFTGLKADLLYTYKQGSFEQDAILHEQPPDPASLGLNPATTKLQVLTEFFNGPKPKVKTHPVKKANGISDTALYFGNTIMGRGRAFLFGDGSSQPQPSRHDVLAYKSWVEVQGRTFLIEEVPLTQAMLELQTLPKTSSNFKSSPDSMFCKPSKTRWLPSAQPIQASTKRIQLAKTDLNQAPGFVLDYVVLVTDQTDFTFQGDTTYLITSVVNLDGVTTFEGGTVIKWFIGEVCSFGRGG